MKLGGFWDKLEAATFSYPVKRPIKSTANNSKGLVESHMLAENEVH